MSALALSGAIGFIMATAGRGASRSVTPMLIWLGAIMLVVMGAGIAILLYRRQVLGKETGLDMHAGIMDQLRTMRDQGEISATEFEEMKSRLVAKVSGRPVSARHAPGTQAPPGSPAERQAAPGFDLTGAPLPRPKDPNDPTQ